MKHDIPSIFSAAFLFVTVMLMGVIFGASYDALQLTKAAEEVIANLHSVKNFHGGGLRGRGVLKRAKAFRPIKYPVWVFGEFSIEVPIIIWDEILNQLLFLLTL